ncbi:MAG: ribosome maturation factor RimM [Methyloceanibacter sp.]|nr:ribosome maturation factor RimM [Methyloceanibacter sp.]
MGGTRKPNGDATLLLVGEIGAAQGLKGEVRLRSYTQEPTDIAAYGPLRNEAGTKTIEIDRIRVTPKALIARIKGVTTREAAEALNRTKLYISREALQQPADDEWYVADMIGLTAVSPEGARLGTVVAIHNFGASDILEIVPDEGPSYLVAFTDDTVPEVAISKGQLVLVPPEEIEAREDDEDGNA